MPLSSGELNRLADSIVASTLTIRLHTGDPGAAGTANRVTAGGGAYANGVAVAAAGWSAASGGDVSNVAAIDFGAAAGGNPGTVTHATAFRGNVFVGSRTVPSTTVNQGDSVQLNAGTYAFNGSST